MGGNMAHRKHCNGVEVAAYDRTSDMAKQSDVDGADLQPLLSHLFQPDVLWRNPNEAKELA
jgi:hypothetical protein